MFAVIQLHQLFVFSSYRDIIADVNIFQGTLFHEDTAHDLAPDVDPEQNDTQKGEESHGKSYRETSKKLRKPKPAVHRVCIFILNQFILCIPLWLGFGDLPNLIYHTGFLGSC
jgi:hypothetical protein